MSDARTSARFRLMERAVGWMLVDMAALAAKHQDWHEWRHIIAQLTAGESVDCGPDCTLRGRPLDGVHGRSSSTENQAEPKAKPSS